MGGLHSSCRTLDQGQMKVPSGVRSLRAGSARCGSTESLLTRANPDQATGRRGTFGRSRGRSYVGDRVCVYGINMIRIGTGSPSWQEV